MIHIATVHWQNDRWINIQLEHIKHFIKEEYRVYAFLNGISKNFSDSFYYISKENIIEHYIKLNILADIIRFSSTNDDDLLLFLDGDAFPVSDIIGFIRTRLENHKLVAIQRFENCGDIQPHPAFCATSIKFWNEIEGNWGKEVGWKDNQGSEIKDVGGTLLGKLNEKGVNWYKMHRSRSLFENPVSFGIYEEVVYHHGSGFRNNMNRMTLHNAGINRYYNRVLIRVLNIIPDNLIKRIKLQIHPKNRIIKKLVKNSNRVSKEAYQFIKEKNPFMSIS